MSQEAGCLVLINTSLLEVVEDSGGTEEDHTALNENIGDKDENSGICETTRTSDVTEVDCNKEGDQGSIQELALVRLDTLGEKQYKCKSNGIAGLEFSVGTVFFTPMRFRKIIFFSLLCQEHNDNT